MKNQADYSLYKCPYSHVRKEFEHVLKGPEGYEATFGVWCNCGFRGPVFCLDPAELKLERLDAETGTAQMTIDRDWLRKKIEADPDDLECEAGILHLEAPAQMTKLKKSG